MLDPPNRLASEAAYFARKCGLPTEEAVRIMAEAHRDARDNSEQQTVVHSQSGGT